jgi:hypothetical protein
MAVNGLPSEGAEKTKLTKPPGGKTRSKILRG